MTLRRRLASLLSPAKKAISSSEYWNSKYQTEEFIYTKTANRFVIELCEGLKPGTAIDVAGGEGRNTVWLAEQGWRVENVDISAVGLAKCNQFAIERGVSDKVSTLEASGADFVSTLAPADLGMVPYLQVEQALLERSLTNLVSQLKSGAHLDRKSVV